MEKQILIREIPNRSLRTILSVYSKLARFHLSRYFLSEKKSTKIKRFSIMFIALSGRLFSSFYFFLLPHPDLELKYLERGLELLSFDLGIIKGLIWYGTFLKKKKYLEKISFFNSFKKFFFSFESFISKPLQLKHIFNFLFLNILSDSFYSTSVCKKSSQKISPNEILIISTVENIRYYDIVIFDVILCFFSFFVASSLIFLSGLTPFFYFERFFSSGSSIWFRTKFEIINLFKNFFEIFFFSLRSTISLISINRNFLFVSFFLDSISLSRFDSFMKTVTFFDFYLFAYNIFKKIYQRTFEEENFY